MVKASQRRFLNYILICAILWSSFGFIAAPQEVKAGTLPEIYITELIPNAKNVKHPTQSGNYDEAYELIELYNNSSQNIRLGDLKIVNREGHKDSDTEKPPWSYDAVEAEKIIPPKGVMVVWLKQGTNPFTFDDFYNFQLAKNPKLQREMVAVATSSDTNLHNTANRSLIVYKGTKKIVVASYIGVGNVDTKDDSGIHFSYPDDGSINMRKTSYNVASTPGIVADSQVVPLPFSDVQTTVTWGDGQATVQWDVPPAKEGVNTDYQYVNIMDATGTTKLAGPILKGKNSAVIKPLENGKSYTFLVKLVSDVTGLESSGSATAPGQPAGSSIPPVSGVYQDPLDVGIQATQPTDLAAFLSSSVQGPVIPGLQQYLVPQGMAYDAAHNWILISHYREGKSSMLTVVDMATGQLIKALELYSGPATAYKGHAGGVAVSPNHVWLSSDYKLYQIAMDDLVNAQDGDKLVFTGSFSTETKGSFLTYADGMLWSGEYEDVANYSTRTSHHVASRDNLPHHGWVGGYRLNAAGAPSAVPEQLFSIPDKIQGMTFMQDRIVFSRSGGRTNMSQLMVYKNPVKLNLPSDLTVQVGGTDVPLTILDGVHAVNSLTAPPMSEGLFEYNGKLYVLFESGAMEYVYGGAYPLDRIYAVDLRSYLRSDARVPELLITEVSPAPKGTDEPNEFVEIYNTTDREIDLSSYKLYYYYSPGSSQPWYEGVTKWDIVAKDDITGGTTKMTIGPKGTKIIWLIKPQFTRSPYTVSLFNTEFGTSLSADAFVYANLREGDAMSDTGKRFVAIVGPGGDKGKDRISMVAYNTGAGEGSCVTDSKSGTIPVTCDFARPSPAEKPTGESVDYYYPQLGINPDSKFMEHRGTASMHQIPTPGTVKPEQVAYVAAAEVPDPVSHVTVTWGDKQAKLQWSDPSAATEFEVMIQDKDYKLIGFAPKGAQSYTVTGMENGKDVQFKLTVVSLGLQSASVLAEPGYPTDGVAPAQPIGLTGESRDGEIILNWTANTEADLAGYKVFINDQPLSDKRYDAAADQTGIVFKSELLEDGLTYRFSIAAVDTSRLASEQSAPVTIKYEGGPNGFKGTATDRSVTLTWNPMLIDLLGYRVYQNNAPVTSSVYTVTYSTYSYTVSGLTNGQKYTFAVTGVKRDSTETPKSVPIELTPYALAGIALELPGAIKFGQTVSSVVYAVYDGRDRSILLTDLTFTSGDASIASVDATTGLVKGLKPGKTYIEAKHGSSGNTDRKEIEVKTDLVSVAFSGQPATLYVGDRIQLKLIAKYSDLTEREITTDAGVTFESTAPSVAVVSATALLEGKAPGQATIKAKYEGLSVETVVAVTAKPVQPVQVNSLEISGIPTAYYVGDNAQLKLNAKYSDNSTKDVTSSASFTSNRTDIAVVSTTGYVQAKARGEATIKATFGGQSVEIKVTVIDRPYVGCSNCVSYGPAPRTNASAATSLGTEAFRTSAVKDAAGRAVMKLDVEASRLSDAFGALNETNHNVTIQYNGNEPIVQVSLPAEALQQGGKAGSDARLVLHIGSVAYELPLAAINLDALAKELGAKVDKMTVNVIFTAQSGQDEARLKAIAEARSANLLGTAYDFTIQAAAAGKTVEVKQFNGQYAVRTLESSGKMDPSKSTGVIIDPGRGMMYFAPTTFTASGGKTQASIMSQSNSIYAVVELSRTFADVKGHWSQKDVELLASKLVVSGVDDRNFAPDAQITRAQFATMLVTALGLSGLADNVKAAPKFKDVAAGDWFASAVAVAAEKGLISGYENNEFRPNANVTREEMAVMVVRALQLVDKRDVPAAKLVQFSDGTAIGSWASASVAKAVDTGIIQGVTDTSFEPGQYATRAQAATMLKRMLQYLKFMN